MENAQRNERVGSLAGPQHGCVTWAQLLALELHPATIGKWTHNGYLTRVHPGVYAVGHRPPTREAALWAAVLYAGPGAMLSHATAACWHGLIEYPPSTIEVSTPRGVDSLSRVRVYGRRRRVLTVHRGIPVTSIAQTMVDLAAVTEPRLVRKALARLDFRRQLNVRELEQACAHGRLGSKALREALAIHQPQLARANGRLEENFILFCERWEIPMPVFNVRLHGVLVDAYWPDHGLVVELDGAGAHSSAAQRHSDKSNDLKLRSHGLKVIRYDWKLVMKQPALVHADVMRELEHR
jgi:Transcriptional regulator, AbiEi antitoxin/Protein of unknown function (DUF559)